MDDRDYISEMPEPTRQDPYAPQPALQEYEWAREPRRRDIPIAVVEALLAEMGEDD